ncbi:myotubularin-related protein 13 isoform X2 [Nematostella vectensis]|uniref:myotubularin-related protein 13 isoform X2 n=1 Tax=Nematostella vectensis TaxID=45351 RepID=UPI00207790C3|nr:myotubularin-related protein 13 isoform X2 [Nematostella vectensis]
MSRLADYFAIVGIDKDTSYGEGLKGKVLQRFPPQDRKDVAFPEGIELFCQPTGWKTSYYCRPQTFFVSVLTDMEGDHKYLACFTFYEPYLPVSARSKGSRASLSDTSSVKTATDGQPGITVTNEDLSLESYVPKTLCLVSAVTYFEILKNCLTTIYLAFMAGNEELLEKLVGSILGLVRVPPPGGPKLAFSIGAGDRQTLCPPLCDTIPVTGVSVSTVFHQIGIHNMLSLFCAAVTENKILFISSSFVQLTTVTRAMLALMYPLKFSYVYIPILPAALLDFLSAPTPFIMGVHESYKDNIPDTSDVILVDIDGGHLSIPDSVNLAILPEPLMSRARRELCLVMNPHLISADYVFQQPPPKSALPLQDKEIRAIFLRILAQTFAGYRSCLTLIRIHPKPVITFHKARFLEQRGMIGDDFFSKVLESMSFSQFVATRGPPYRTCDLFDQLTAEVETMITSECDNDGEILANIQQIAQQLFENEPSSDQLDDNLQKSLNTLTLAREADGARREFFPALDASIIDQFIKEEGNQEEFTIVRPDPEIVPCGRGFTSRQQHYMAGRKLEVLKDCVSYIFDNKISEARKALPSVLRSLKSKGAQLALCHELSLRAKQNRSVLEHDQFDLVVRLMNNALQEDASMDNTAVAAALLPLTSTFCRKLATGCMQFAYTCVQDHPIWEKQQFWEEAFYTDVQTQIKQLYIVEEAPRAVAEDTLEKPDRSSRSSLTPSAKHRSFTGKENMLSKESRDSSDSESKVTLKPPKSPPFKAAPNALDIAAEQIKKWATMKQEERDNLISSEESIVYSQAIHYANRMVYMRIPLNACEMMPSKTPNTQPPHSAGGLSTSMAGSIAGGRGEVEGSSLAVDKQNGGESVSISVTDSGWDSFHDEDERDTIADSVTRFVVRFVDRVGTEAGIHTEHMKSLYAMIPGVVAMHIESLEPVNAQYKRLAPQRKIKIMRPALLPGEEMLCNGLRCYLVPDGRELGRGGEVGGPTLLPAEGAAFLTNYRVIFKGTPVDQFASEMIVTRSFPVGSVVREKKINVHYMQHLEQWLHECVQLRSSTFQLMKLVFDEEVGADAVLMFTKRIKKLRSPLTVFSSFAFIGKGLGRTPTVVIQKQMERKGTLRKTRKRFVDLTHSKRGGSFGSHLKGSMRKRRYHVKGSNDVRKRSGSPSGSITTDDESVVDLNDINDLQLYDEPNAVQGVDRLSSMPCCQDYSRLGFGNILRASAGGPWRISMVNYTYTVCRSYPAVVVVPQSISDDTVLRVAKNHRQNRFPVAIWKHPKNKATLVRAGGIERSSVASMIRSGMGVGGSMSGNSIPSSSVEQEKLFAAVVSATPLSKNKSVARQNSLHHGVILNTEGYFNQDKRDETDRGQLVEATLKKKGWEPAALYVLGDKAHLRNVKQEAYPKCEFVPVELPDVRAVRACFKKFLRACCPATDSPISFVQQVNESEWLHQLSAVMNVSNVLVDLIDIQGSSVMVCFEDGWDVTAQVVCLAEICLDSHYRSIEGFKTLIEKEWLGFGHRFTQRCNQVESAQSGFTPVFLQFLDAVHQIMRQYPLSFEFNHHFLCTLAYHHVSMRFRTFLMDSEHERYQAGWMIEEEGKRRGKSLWDYIDAQNQRSPAFYNFMYSPDNQKVLRPFCRISNLVVWKYYLTENLSTGPPFDAELINEVETTVEDQQSPEHKHDYFRRCMTGCYGDVTQFARDQCTWFLQELSRLDEEADHKPETWRELWNKLEYPPPTRMVTTQNTRWAKQQALMQHKRSTMEVILRGKLQEEDRGAQGFSQPHNFVKHMFLTPSNCDYCLQLIIGFVSKGLKCTECGYNCHEKCQSQVPWQCKKRDLAEQPGTSLAKSTISLPESEAPNKQLHCGYLHKRGHLFKQWKSRWFVLDTQRNQLRYYETRDDPHCAGFIDLGEMIAVVPGNPLPGAPKGAEKGAFFDLRTTKRVLTNDG